MPDFSSFRELGQAFLTASRRAEQAIQDELATQGAVITGRAKAMFGTYQPGWQQLADATQNQRTRLGFTPNDPLFRSGGLQGVVTFTVTRSTVQPAVWIGVPDGVTLTDPSGKDVQASDVMIWQEFGTAKMPPRPVFGLVAHHLDEPVHAFGIGIVHRMRL